MTDRRITTGSWLAVAALAAGLYLVAVACSSDASSDRAADDGAAGENAADGGSTVPTEPTSAPRVPAPTAAPGPPTENPDLLSAWGQLAIVDGRLEPTDGVVPYTLNTALFSDYAHKLRTVRLPDGSSPAAYDPEDVFAFPVGTVITKTFYYPIDAADAAADSSRVRRAAQGPDELLGPLDLSTVRLLETRVLVHREDGWAALPYVWNAEQSEAVLKRTGDLLPLTLIGDSSEDPFTYVVPDVNQCSSCHATNHTTGLIQPIGPKARHLNADVDVGNGPEAQLARWDAGGLVAGLPEPADIPRAAVWDDDTASLEDRARSYLDINCAHCHNEAGPADTSGLFLERSTELGPRFGVCKAPIAAGTGTGGRLVGIDPGAPDDSIFVYRLETTDPAAMMPELGRSLTHTEGVDLVSAWIASLDGAC